MMSIKKIRDEAATYKGGPTYDDVKQHLPFHVERDVFDDDGIWNDIVVSPRTCLNGRLKSLASKTVHHRRWRSSAGRQVRHLVRRQ